MVTLKMSARRPGKKHKKAKAKKKIDEYAPRPELWWYYKDNFVPVDWLVTAADVNRWQEEMTKRYPDFKFVVKFREQIDKDKKQLLETRQISFWLEWTNNSPGVNLNLDPDLLPECYDETFMIYLDRRDWGGEENLPWHPLEDFVNSDKNPSDLDRDKSSEENPIREMFERVPDQKVAFKGIPAEWLEEEEDDDEME